MITEKQNFIKKQSNKEQCGSFPRQFSTSLKFMCIDDIIDNPKLK